MNQSLLDTIRNRIPTFPAHEVTRIREGAEQPAEAGELTAAHVATIWQSVVDMYAEGLYPAVGFCLRRRGQVLLDRTIGHVHGVRPNEAPAPDRRLATPDTLFNLFSASKSVTAMVIHLLDERGKLHVDDRVTEYLPEFGKHGKDKITIRQLLDHTAGIPVVPSDVVDMDVLAKPEVIRQMMCDMPLQRLPGSAIAYHALTGGFVLNEVVRAITGEDLREVLAREILRPLKFGSMNYGVSPDRIADVARHETTGEKPPKPFAYLMKRALGVGYEEAVNLSNDPRFITGVIPSGNVIATSNEASRFYQLLLNGGELDGVRIFEPRTIHRATSEQSFGRIDQIMGLPVRYSMGFMLGSRILNVYGSHTKEAFGHMGFTNVVLWADRERDISVSLFTSGKPFITPGALKWLRVMRVISDTVPRGRVLAGKRP